LTLLFVAQTTLLSGATPLQLVECSFLRREAAFVAYHAADWIEFRFPAVKGPL